ncbi:spore germination protein [Serpentinicella sp. ANB-PHB4]|uniref:spore germination protein n=1 Tax=Serpentinicella sp. ANB-PHB4 TaxID=3074076 RepID=UPI00285D4854|nr:spore germination protein [Serpentinicella sp. ANB-PHB4]MDR5659445.1 spore germination protein [Serpentinicella sp. ANB-PHB4]
MLKKFKQKLFSKNINRSNKNTENIVELLKAFEVFKDIDNNVAFIQNILTDSEDVVYRELMLWDRKAILIYIDGLVDRNIIENHIIRRLQNFNEESENSILTVTDVKEKILAISNPEIVKNYNEIINGLLTGESLLLIDNEQEALTLNSQGLEKRGVEEPFAEQGLRGPRDGFIEDIDDNVAAIRKRIKDTRLKVQYHTLGQRTQTKVALVYLNDKAPEHVVKEIEKRIQEINVDSIVGSASVEQLIENHKWTVFPQVLASERPDRIATSILDGRVAIMVDGTPYNLIAPGTFAMFFNSSDDYYERSIVTSIIRIIRYMSFLIASTLPGLYVALTAYHPGMLPTTLVLFITGSRVGLPLPSVVEMLLMLFTLEILLEAAIRLPKPISQTVGIVGGLVIGQSAVQAGLVSPLVVIIIGFTAITSFVFPYYTFALTNRALRIFFLIGGAFWGLFGIVIFWILLIIHLASIESFGVRYLEDFFSFKKEKLKDTFLKDGYPSLLGNAEAIKGDKKE